MATLSDQEIRSLIDSGRLKIDPPPAVYSPSTVDLTLASTFLEFDEDLVGSSSAEITIDTRDGAGVMDALRRFMKKVEINEGDYYLLGPGKFVLAETREHITLPDFLAARVEGRSTLARLGLSIHQSAPTVHPTYDNTLALEMKNSGSLSIKLFPGISVCQLIFETMSIPSANPLVSIHQPQ